MSIELSADRLGAAPGPRSDASATSPIAATSALNSNGTHNINVEHTSAALSPRSGGSAFHNSFSDELGARAVHNLGAIKLKGHRMTLSFDRLHYAVKGKDIVHSVRYPCSYSLPVPLL